MRVTGGRHVVTLNTGMYESFQYALPDFYDQHPDYSANVRYHITFKNSVVDVMHQVYKRGTASKRFVVNLYNVTSRILVNEKTPNVFKNHF